MTEVLTKEKLGWFGFFLKWKHRFKYAPSITDRVIK